MGAKLMLLAGLFIPPAVVGLIVLVQNVLNPNTQGAGK